MNARRRIRPLDALESPRFTHVATFARLPWDRDLTDIDAVFLGVPFDDGTTFRTGARMGPAAIREHSRLLRPYNLFLDVSPFDVLNIVDYGDVDVVPGYFHATCERVEATLRTLTKADVLPFVAGGDHSVTLPVLRRVAEAYGPVNIVHFDSHFGFWDQYWGQKYTHGTWLRRALEEGLLNQVAQVGIRGPQFTPDDLTWAQQQGIHVATIRDYHREGPEMTIQRVMECMDRTTPLYVSWDIDVVDPAYSPGTGTPEVGGMTSWGALECLRALEGFNLVGADVVEVAPPYDGAGGITSLLAANLLYEMLSLVAKRRRDARG